MTKPMYLFRKPIAPNIWNIGTMMATKGTIMESISRAMTASLPLSWYTSKP